MAGVLLLPGVSVSTESDAGFSTFEELADSVGLVVTPPAGYQISKGQQDPVLAYEYAISHPDQPLLVRFSIRPLSWIEIDYNDPHNATPEPNHLFPLIFQTLVSDMTKGLRSVEQEYSQADARAQFGADWASLAALDLAPENRNPYTQVMLLALHRNNIADVYVAIHYEDFDGLKEEIDRALASIRFES